MKPRLIRFFIERAEFADKVILLYWRDIEEARELGRERLKTRDENGCVIIDRIQNMEDNLARAYEVKYGIGLLNIKHVGCARWEVYET